jgi:hypothetical protein
MACIGYCLRQARSGGRPPGWQQVPLRCLRLSRAALASARKPLEICHRGPPSTRCATPCRAAAIRSQNTPDMMARSGTLAAPSKNTAAIAGALAQLLVSRDFLQRCPANRTMGVGVHRGVHPGPQTMDSPTH